MKCANCDNKASYEYRVTKNKSLFYCGKDLPKFLEERRKAGLLTITDQFSEDLTSALDALSTTPIEVPIEEPTEEPKPKKKTDKKSEK